MMFSLRTSLRAASCALLVISSASAAAHHWVGDVYNARQRFVAEVEVQDFELINPHPLMFVEIVSLSGPSTAPGVEIGQTWTLEMDNRRELTALGFSDKTFLAGERIRVAVDPSRNSQYRQNTMYLRALEHPRSGFIYIHNVRRLFPISTEGDSLSIYLEEIR